MPKKEIAAEGIRSAARRKGSRKASGAVRYLRHECARRIGQVGRADVRPVSRRSRVLAHRAERVRYRGRRMRHTALLVRIRSRCAWGGALRPGTQSILASGLPGGGAPAARLSSRQPIANLSPAGNRMSAGLFPTPRNYRKPPPHQYQPASPFWEMPLPDDKPTIDRRASGPDVIRTNGRARHSVSNSTHAREVD